jgi:hypothetical protein
LADQFSIGDPDAEAIRLAAYWLWKMCVDPHLEPEVGVESIFADAPKLGMSRKQHRGRYPLLARVFNRSIHHS